MDGRVGYCWMGRAMCGNEGADDEVRHVLKGLDQVTFYTIYSTGSSRNAFSPQKCNKVLIQIKFPQCRVEQDQYFNIFFQKQCLLGLLGSFARSVIATAVINDIFSSSNGSTALYNILKSD